MREVLPQTLACAFAATMLVTPGGATAQPLAACTVPESVPSPYPVRPRGEETPRRVAQTGYVLALSWSPTYCARSRGDKRDAFQCAGQRSRFGFVLHGLWPDASGRADPAWCRPARLVPAPIVRANLCRMPSVQLIQRQWAKHGTCMSPRPANYFRAAAILFDALRIPDMRRLGARPGLTAGQAMQAFADANRGVDAAMVAVGTRDGALQEVRLCLDQRMRPARCRPDQRLAGAGTRVRIPF